MAASVVNPSLGSDISAIYDVTATFAEVSGRQCLAEALCRRLITRRGELIYDPNYGFCLPDFLNDDVTSADIAAIQTNITSECLKDERVEAVTVSAQFVGQSQVAAAVSGVITNPAPGVQGVLVVSITITDGQGPFKFTVAASSVTVSLLQVSS